MPIREGGVVTELNRRVVVALDVTAGDPVP
jgi:hypothetical protein